MFKGLVSKILDTSLNMFPDCGRADPASFNDRVALVTEWTPLKKGRTGIDGRKLIHSKNDQLRFRAKVKIVCYQVLLMLFCIAITARSLWMHTHNVSPMAFIPLIFAFIAGRKLYVLTRPIVFDKRKMIFWVGWREPAIECLPDNSSQFVRIYNIHALQLIVNHVTTEENSHISYQLNLVLNNGDRVDVVEYKKRDELRKDAVILSEFLNKPFWDATERRTEQQQDISIDDICKIDESYPKWLADKARKKYNHHGTSMKSKGINYDYDIFFKKKTKK